MVTLLCNSWEPLLSSHNFLPTGKPSSALPTACSGHHHSSLNFQETDFSVAPHMPDNVHDLSFYAWSILLSIVYMVSNDKRSSFFNHLIVFYYVFYLSIDYPLKISLFPFYRLGKQYCNKHSTDRCLCDLLILFLLAMYPKTELLDYMLVLLLGAIIFKHPTCKWIQYLSILCWIHNFLMQHSGFGQ